MTGAPGGKDRFPRSMGHVGRAGCPVILTPAVLRGVPPPTRRGASAAPACAAVARLSVLNLAGDATSGGRWDGEASPVPADST
ncbi:MAG: hypothetical protein AVDCRST_MAG70-2440 [uncultured Thermomicrobiales bacterium]|uniref:Uncharacterized protein n=1 Tax=uncultured Thermomicrobiales bacterium TaxID=1645740 RepID=A0A6J4V6E8_9BACT|nr:MAG: hypothetical protein AVDCRST_MAG70-2440 [uncultured Thermomicrobiales bacterium]